MQLTQSMVASSKTISPNCFPAKIAFCSFSHSKNDTIVMVQNQKCNNGPESTCRLHCDLRLEHGLRTPNEGTNQRNLKLKADLADKICFGCT